VIDQLKAPLRDQIRNVLAPDQDLRRKDPRSQNEFGVVILESADGEQSVASRVIRGSGGPQVNLQEPLIKLLSRRQNFKVRTVVLLHTHPARNEPLSINDIAMIQQVEGILAEQIRKLGPRTVTIKMIAVPIETDYAFQASMDLDLE
jgi:hypothetical protein